MRWRIAVLGTLGALLTAVSAAFVFVPDALLGIRPVGQAVDALSATDPKLVMLGATVVVGLYVVIAVRSTAGEASLAPVSDAERWFDSAATNPPEAVTADRRQRTAVTLDADVDAAIERGGEPLTTIRDDLAQTAASVYAERVRTDPETARTAVTSGEWTDDAVAGAFLAGEEGPTPSILSRIRLWLTPERERERRIERTVAAIRDLREVDR